MVCLKWTYATILLMLALSISQSIMKWTSHRISHLMRRHEHTKIHEKLSPLKKCSKGDYHYNFITSLTSFTYFFIDTTWKHFKVYKYLTLLVLFFHLHNPLENHLQIRHGNSQQSGNVYNIPSSLLNLQKSTILCKQIHFIDINSSTIKKIFNFKTTQL